MTIQPGAPSTVESVGSASGDSHSSVNGVAALRAPWPATAGQTLRVQWRDHCRSTPTQNVKPHIHATPVQSVRK